MNQSPEFEHIENTPFVDEVFQTPLQPKNSQANILAIVSLIAGIASLVCTWCCCCLYVLALVFGVAGIVTAILSNLKNNKKMSKKAIAGLILSILGVISFAVLCILDITLSGLSEEEILALMKEFFASMGMDFDEFINEVERSMME